MTTSTYNLMGDSRDIEKLLEEWTNVEVEERFEPDDVNVDIPDDELDGFLQDCDEKNIQYELV